MHLLHDFSFLFTARSTELSKLQDMTTRVKALQLQGRQFLNK